MKKIAILALGLLICRLESAEKQDSAIYLAKTLGCDIVGCNFREANDPENNWGINSVSFTAAEAEPSHRWYADDDSFRELYKGLAAIGPHKIQTAFYRCMANLENPKTAVKYGEYKGCIKEAWKSRPWGAIDIHVSEKKYKTKGIMEGRTFNWYDPIKSLSFLD